MAFGPAIDVPLMSGLFALILNYRVRLVRGARKIKLPRMMPALLSAVALLIIEEQINCMPEWCMQVIVPPTIWLLLGIVFVFLSLIRYFRIRNLIFQTLLFSTFGMIFELAAGPISSHVQMLLATQPIFLCFITFWIGISYAFVIVLPLSILNEHSLKRVRIASRRGRRLHETANKSTH